MFDHDENPGFLKEWVFAAESRIDPHYIGGRAILLLGLTIYGLKIMSKGMEKAAYNFIHNVNLAFHEAGHPIFGIFGEFMGYAGGTLMQLLVPLAVMVAFLWKRDAFSASFGLWWLGESFMDIAPYANDSREMKLMLIGGGTGREIGGHDWEYLLGAFGWQKYDHAIAHGFFFIGCALMITAIVWGATMLWIQWRLYQKHGADPYDFEP